MALGGILPEEVLCIVFQAIYEPGRFQTNWQRSLLRCALVCKAWYRLGAPSPSRVIWETRSKKGHPIAIRAAYKNLSLHSYEPYHIDALLQTLRGCKEAADAVRGVRFEGCNLLQVRDLVRLCTKLKEFGLQDTDIDEAKAGIWLGRLETQVAGLVGRARLQRISLTRERPSLVRKIIEACPAVTALEIFDTLKDDNLAWEGFVSKTPEITELHLGINRIYDDSQNTESLDEQWEAHVIISCCAKLHKLRIESFPVMTPQQLECTSFPKLRAFEYTLEASYELLTLKQLMTKMPHLKDLRLDLGPVAKRIEDEQLLLAHGLLGPLNIWCTLPSTLEALWITRAPSKVAELLIRDFLPDPHWLPRLRDSEASVDRATAAWTRTHRKLAFEAWKQREDRLRQLAA